MQGTEPGKDGKHRPVVRLRPLYSCEAMCGVKPGDPGHHKRRAAMRCSLPDFDPEKWDRNADRGAAELAEEFCNDLVGVTRANGARLEFDLDVHGCPWGWAQSRFVSSVAQYMGKRDAGSVMRSTNSKLAFAMQRLDPQTVERILDAVAFAEDHEDGAFSIYHKTCNGL